MNIYILKNIEEQLTELGKALVRRKNKPSNADWTHEIKVFFLGFFRNRDPQFTVLIGDNEIANKDGGEWLYDITAIKLTEDLGHLVYVDTAIESEWGNTDEVKEDFQKLLQSKARTKIMVFQDSKSEPEKFRLDTLRTAMRLFDGIDEKESFVTFCWQNEGEKFGMEVLNKGD